MKKQIIISVLCVFCSSLSVYALAANVAVTPQDKHTSTQQLINQQARQKAIEETLSPQAPDVRLLPPLKSNHTLHFPQERLCFQIEQVELLERDALPYIMPLWPLAKQAEGQCLGGEGINLLMSELQNRIIRYGYITTRVVAPE